MSARPRGTCRRERVRRPTLEALELRAQPTVLATLNPAGLLAITATAADSVDVVESSGRVLINGLDPTTGPATAASVRALEVQGGPAPNLVDLSHIDPARFPALTRIQVNAGGGFDHLIAPANLPATWAITGPDAGFLSGPAFGSISVFTFVSVENLTAGAGDDLFAFAPGSGFSGGLDAGPGLDQLNFSDFPTGVGLRLTTPAPNGFSGSAGLLGLGFAGIDRLVGSPAIDTLLGTDLDATWTLASTSTYTANAQALEFEGFERLRGGSAADTFDILGDDLDLVSADLIGGDGDDFFRFHPGVTLFGSIDGQAGRDTLDYDPFDHPLEIQLTQSIPDGFNGQQPDTLGPLGFRGVDRLIATRPSVGLDTLTGLPVDSLWTHSSYQTTTGGLLDFSGFEILRGKSAADRYQLDPTPGLNLRIHDIGGDDTLDFAAATVPITLDLDSAASQSLAPGSTLTLSGQFENFLGSPFADTLTAAPLALAPRQLSGGDPINAPGDLLRLHASPSQSPTIVVAGYAPLTQQGWERIEFLNPPLNGVADLLVSINTLPASPLVGQPLTVLINVVNHGPDPATNLNLLAVIRRADGSSLTGPDFQATIPTLAPGQSTTVTLTVVPDRAGPIQIEALVTANQTDPNTADNFATQIVNVTAPIPSTPLIRDVTRLARPGYRTRILIRFRGLLDPRSAGDLANYSLVIHGPDRLFGTADDVVIRLQFARYNAATRSILLVTRRRFRQPRRPLLTIGGTSSPGLLDQAGHRLADTPYKILLPIPTRRPPTSR